MVKVARAAETVCADSINTPLLGKKNFRQRRTGILAWNDGNSPVMRAVAAILLLMMKSFACFLGRATFRGATFRWLDGVSPYRQTDVEFAIDEQKRFPDFHQLTAKLACNR